MVQLQISLARETGATLPYLQRVFDRVRQDRGYSVEVTFHGWDVIWKELVNTAIYKRGADLSDTGSTWIAALVAMDALRPFARHEIDQLGEPSSFLPSAWQNVSLVDDPRVWAIPFLADARVIYYWRDMLQQAGLDPQTAFLSPEQCEETCARLQRVIEVPWVDITDPNRHDMLYHAASWIWAKGGDFLSRDGKHILVGEPAARAGLRTYFGLRRFMPRTGQPLDNIHAINLFFDRQAAALMSGPWLFSNMKARGFAPERLAQVGIALPPGPPFVGGTYLIVWQHTRHPGEAIELIRRLTRPQFQAEFCPVAGLLPVSQEAWATDTFAANQNYKVLFQAMMNGRSFLNIPLWGMVEDKLTLAFGQIWADLIAQPDQDIEAVLARHLDAAVSRLNMTLAQ
jgi:multiple sugar transport system substrate-binding protein